MKHIHFFTKHPKAKFVVLCLAFLSPLAVGITYASAAPSTSEGRYIVTLKDSVRDARGTAAEHSHKRHFRVSSVYSHIMKGYAASMTASEAQALKHDPQVASVETDGKVSALTTESNAPWGLDRIDQRKLPLSSTFTYHATGKGVKIYIIDTGIRKSHADFSGRVVDGFDAVDGSLPADDCDGHGTHVAGTAGGNQYGIAKEATLVSVRVLDCDGNGYWSWVIAGIDYVTGDHQPNQPAVANMSLGGSPNVSVDNAVKRSIAKGVGYAIAAGNDGGSACQSSPGRVPEAMTIGATNNTDTKPSWSDWGSCVDWFAPGVGIKSDWYSSDTATNILSGTSMASPHTAGVAALYLQTHPVATPKQVRDALYLQTTKAIVKQAKSTNNHLLFTNY